MTGRSVFNSCKSTKHGRFSLFHNYPACTHWQEVPIVHFTKDELQPNSQDWRHRVEAVGTVNWALSIFPYHRQYRDLAEGILYFFFNSFSLGFCLLHMFCYSHRHDSNSFRNFRVFSIHTYAYALIICIYYIPGMSSRTLKFCTLFIKKLKKCTLTTKRSNRSPTISNPTVPSPLCNLGSELVMGAP